MPQPTPTETVQLTAANVTLEVGSEPSTGSTQTVTAHIIRAGQVFDGENKRYNLTDGGQAEGQPSLFALEDGATLRNVVIGNLSADGVHCYGSCLIENVWWEDVGEDAATAKGPAGSTMHINCGSARSASDKTFQHNGRGEMLITNFSVEDAGKLYRSCGDCTNNGGPRVVTINNVKLKNVLTVVGINTEMKGVTNFDPDRTYISNLTVEHTGSHKVKICQVYSGAIKGSGSASALGVEFETASCNVSPSDITLIGATQLNLTDYTGTAVPKQQ
ncbi:MAG: pectate lyase [Marinagarivorans sp.]|nr:pectate lyase [Marinagarivorans sp.]